MSLSLDIQTKYWKSQTVQGCPSLKSFELPPICLQQRSRITVVSLYSNFAPCYVLHSSFFCSALFFGPLLCTALFLSIQIFHFPSWQNQLASLLSCATVNHGPTKTDILFSKSRIENIRDPFLVTCFSGGEKHPEVSGLLSVFVLLVSFLNSRPAASGHNYLIINNCYFVCLGNWK